MNCNVIDAKATYVATINNHDEHFCNFAACKVKEWVMIDRDCCSK